MCRVTFTKPILHLPADLKQHFITEEKRLLRRKERKSQYWIFFSSHSSRSERWRRCTLMRYCQRFVWKILEIFAVLVILEKYYWSKRSDILEECANNALYWYPGNFCLNTVFLFLHMSKFCTFLYFCIRTSSRRWQTRCTSSSADNFPKNCNRTIRLASVFQRTTLRRSSDSVDVAATRAKTQLLN